MVLEPYVNDVLAHSSPQHHLNNEDILVNNVVDQDSEDVASQTLERGCIGGECS